MGKPINKVERHGTDPATSAIRELRDLLPHCFGQQETSPTFGANRPISFSPEYERSRGRRNPGLGPRDR
ncbi:MAG: hypothetical protein A2607_01005 [Candidatus Vogelbacteria bacterium RIFOXYD1_FULL_42_15]|nr:MAG: hypothetical protein A2607_01005 [Candidatus Vogelbacteria bacterium RIFOXYD1_FULL_42_15]